MFKDTTSYKLITTLEKMNISQNKKYKLLYLLYSIFQYIKYKYKMYMKIKLSNNIIDLIIELFKEYYYLYQIINDNNLNNQSIFTYYINNNNIISKIFYDDIGIYIEYNVSTKENCIYIDTSKINPDIRGFNLTDKNLNMFEISDTVYYIIKLILKDILYMMKNVIMFYNQKENTYV